MKTVFEVVLILAAPFLCGKARGQVILTPVATDFLVMDGQQAPFTAGSGYGSVYGYQGPQPYDDIQRETVIDFNISGLQQTPSVSNATLTLSVQNLLNGVPVTIPINISTFYGESNVQAGDWNKGAYCLSFGALNVAQYVYTLDLTLAVQAAVDQGESFLDVELSTPETPILESPLFIDAPSGGSLTVIATGPSITRPPLTQTAEAGTTAWFCVEVTNAPSEPTYQWYFNGTNALGSTTNAFLELTNVQPVQAGAYTVVVTNLMAAVTSAPALLSVIPPVERRLVPAVSLTGSTGSLLHVEYANGLVAAAPQWLSLSNVTLSGGPQFYFELQQPLPVLRYYRAWQSNGPQPKLAMSMATEIPLTGTIGSSVRVDYITPVGPTNAWVTLDTVLLTNTTQLYFDVTAFQQPARLYRLVVKVKGVSS